MTRFEVVEGISELFEISIDALSDEKNIDFSKIIGGNCTLKIDAGPGLERVYNGCLAEAEWIGADGHRQGYRLVLRPWPWLLSFTGNCRIFKDTSVSDVVKLVFDKYQFNRHRFELSDSYPTLEYCVQYRESDLAFVLRLLEENGIYYYFEHQDNAHTMVLTDRASAHKTVPGVSSVMCDQEDAAGARDRQLIAGWTARRRFVTGKSVHSDYDYASPNKAMLADHEGGHRFASGVLEHYDWPGRYVERADGQRMAKARQESHDAAHQRRRAVGWVPMLAPGFKVAVEKNPTPSENGDYLVVRCRHVFEAEEYRSGGRDPGGYRGSYEFLPAALQFRAPITTPKPRIPGTQTAKVVAERGGEIDVDKDGRILVQFFWDRDRVDSRRVRVAQVWAGKGWGGIVIPRVGMEVVVTFLEGDPDQPLVIGCVYNGENPPPYDLPKQKNISGVKSESTEGGSGYNEFIFDDTKNQEKIRLHAEKDLESTVDNTELRTIKGEQVGSPKGTYARKTVIEKGDEVLEVATGHRDEKIKQGDDKLVIGQGNRTCEISMGNDNLTIKMGNRTTKLDLGKDFTEAMQSITLKVASSKLTIDPTGITLDAPMITFKGGAMIKSSAPMTNISSDAMTIVKGGIVTIN